MLKIFAAYYNSRKVNEEIGDNLSLEKICKYYDSVEGSESKLDLLESKLDTMTKEIMRLLSEDQVLEISRRLKGLELRDEEIEPGDGQRMHFRNQTPKKHPSMIFF